MPGEKQSISVRSAVTINNREPLVFMTWQGVEGTLSSTQARTRGLALLRAVAIAQTEEVIFKTLAPEAKRYKGFGEYKPTKDEIMSARLLELLRENQDFNHPDIKPIYGTIAQKGLISYRWSTIEKILTQEEAQEHAAILIETAEAAENDSFFYRFFEEKLQFESEFVEDIIRDYQLFKQQKYLENLI
jgi:hypothetical protein